MIEAHWGESEPFSLGVEEELMLLDAETLDQVPAVERLLGELDGAGDGRFKTELFASVVELNTPVCHSADEALERIDELRATAGRAAGRIGLWLAGAGTHPQTIPEQQEIVPERRYEEMVAYAGLSARRQGVNGLHVHVGMPGGDDCLRVLEGVLPWLPVVLALSANSPYFAGDETGFSSNRALVLAELPRSGAPPYFATYADWERHVERLTRLKLPADYTALWWDVRPHPRFGTLELRMPDQPTAVEMTGAFVALLQALCVTMLERPPVDHDPGLRGVYQQNRWAAARFGLEAELIDENADRKLPASDLARELLDLVGPAARALGSFELLQRLDGGRCEGDRQLEVGRADGLEEVCRDVVARSLPSP
jgi:glutamate---cysteine ligase / carboxylate-amine ligase